MNGVGQRSANCLTRDHPVVPRMMTEAYAAVPSLTSAWNQFLAERRISLSPTSICTDYAYAGKWIERCPVQDLTQGRQVLLWVLGQQPLAAARRVTMFVRCMYRWAASEDVALLPRNPVANFKVPKAPQRDHEITVIPRDEIPLIMVALESKAHHTKQRWALFAEWMLQTGMRTGEVRALTWDDIDGDRVRVHSNYTLTHGLKASTKTNKPRWVPLNSKAKHVLTELERTSTYLFPWNRYAFQTYFRLKVDQLFDAGLVKARYRPYDLRHVAISRWLEAGIPVAQAASWAGNTSEVIWKHYANTTQEYEMPVL
jgi:integrase